MERDSTSVRRAERPDRALRWALSIAVAGVLARLALVWALDLAPYVERFEYDEVARNLVEGRGLGMVIHGAWYRSFGNAPYVLISAAALAVSTWPEAALLGLQALFIIPTTLGAFLLARRICGDAAGLLAASGTAFHPGLLYFDTHKLHPLGFDAMLAVGGLQLAAGLWPGGAAPCTSDASGGRRVRILLSGLVHGIAILQRPTFLLLLPVSLFFLRARRAGRPTVLLYLLFAVLPAGFWLARSLAVYGEPVFNPEAEEFLWRGNNPVASGTNFARGPELVPVFEAAPEEFRREVLGTDETGQRSAFRREALRFLRERTLDAAALYLRKLAAFLWFSEHAGGWYPPALVSVYKAGYAVLALAACGGLLSLRRRPPEARRLGRALVLFFLSVAALQAVFYVETRHRWAVEPLLVVLAAGALAESGTHRHRPSEKRGLDIEGH